MFAKLTAYAKGVVSFLATFCQPSEDLCTVKDDKTVRDRTVIDRPKVAYNSTLIESTTPLLLLLSFAICLLISRSSKIK
jgi:hypothetical protein